MKNLFPYLALVGVGLIYGANYVIAKGLMPDVIGPSGFILLRVYGASALFLVVVSLFGEIPEKKDFPRIALCAVFGIALNQLMFFNGLSLTSPVNGSIIITTTPILVLILSAIMLNERITLRKAIGIGLGAIGAIALIMLSAKSGAPQVSMKGDIMILINATSYAFYLVLAKPLMQKYRPITVISWIFFFGAIYILPFSWNQFTDIDWAGLNKEQWSSILYVVLMATFLVYFLNIYALGKVSPNVVSSFIYLQPVFTLCFAFIFFSLDLFEAKEPFVSFGTVVCTFLIFIGVYLVSSRVRVRN